MAVHSQHRCRYGRSTSRPNGRGLPQRGNKTDAGAPRTGAAGEKYGFRLGSWAIRRRKKTIRVTIWGDAQGLVVCLTTPLRYRLRPERVRRPPSPSESATSKPGSSRGRRTPSLSSRSWRTTGGAGTQPSARSYRSIQLIGSLRDSPPRSCKGAAITAGAAQASSRMGLNSSMSGLLGVLRRGTGMVSCGHVSSGAPRTHACERTVALTCREGFFTG